MANSYALEHLRLLYKAKVANQAQRYKDLKDIMFELCSKKETLSLEEQNLFSIACKKYLSRYRETYHLAIMDAKHHADPTTRAHAKDYSCELKDEFITFCGEVVHIVRNLRRNTANDVRTSAFLLKMEGDYYRYMSEIEPSNIDLAAKAYEKAYALVDTLAVGDAVRLGIVLNYAILLYNSMKNYSEALKVLKEEIKNPAPVESDIEAYRTYLLLRDTQTLCSSHAVDKENKMSRYVAP